MKCSGQTKHLEFGVDVFACRVPPCINMVAQRVDARTPRTAPAPYPTARACGARAGAHRQSLVPVAGNAAIAARVVQRIPKELGHILVIEQQANGAGEHLSHRRGEGLALVQRAHVAHEIAERLPLRGAAACTIAQVLSIGCVEGDPESDEGHVVVRARRLGALQPSQGAVHAQGERAALLCKSSRLGDRAELISSDKFSN